MIMNPRRRHDRNRKIKERRKALDNIYQKWSRSFVREKLDNLEDGYFENNNIMNEFGKKYEKKKTKTKNSYHHYRHKGRFGCKAKEYKHHDLVEIARMDSDEAELNGTNLHKRVK